MSADDSDPEKQESQLQEKRNRASQDVEASVASHDTHSHSSSSVTSRPSSANGPAPANESGMQDIQPVVTIDDPAGIFSEGESAPATRVASARSARRPPAVVVPRAKRRGILARFAVVPEVQQPYDYKNSTKWSITLTIALATAAAPLGSTIFWPALPVLSAEFGVPDTVTNLSIALYMLAMAIFPLWWSALSERYGRRSIYIVSFSMFLIFSVLAAISTNVTMLIVFRVCTGGSSASVQAVGAGTVADIWETFERGRAMGIFYLGPLLGPLIGPIVGGVLAEHLGWQSNMWFLAIYALVCLFMLVLLLPETLARQQTHPDEIQPTDTTLQRTSTVQSAKRQTKRLGASLKRFFLDPLEVLWFLRFPPIQITVFLGAIAFAALYIANVSIQQTFKDQPYGYRTTILGLLYIPPGLGYILTSMLGGRWIDSIMAREARKANRYDDAGKLVYLPEDRMRENMWLANAMYPLSLLVYGWTSQYGVNVAVPLVTLFCYGVSSMLVFSAATTMLTEFVRKKSSAGVAINNFVRNILSCLGTVVAAPWIHAIGVGWVFTTVCLFCMIAGFAGIWLLRRNAQKWRVSMDEALRKI